MLGLVYRLKLKKAEGNAFTSVKQLSTIGVDRKLSIQDHRENCCKSNFI